MILGQGIDPISDMAASRVVFLSKLKTWSAHVCGVKSAPAATCKQQVVPSVHVRVCLIVQPGISRAGLGWAHFAVLSTDRLGSRSQVEQALAADVTCPYPKLLTWVHAVQLNWADMTMHGMIDIN